MVKAILCILALGAGAVQAVDQAPIPSEQDVAVYAAVLEAKIRPDVNRFSRGAGIPTPAPVLTFDRTQPLCLSGVDQPRFLGCIPDEWVQRVETKQPGVKNLPLQGLVSSPVRLELLKLFRDRNRQSQPFPGARLPGLIVVAPDAFEGAFNRESGRTTRGYATFSLPAYAADRWALLYGSYVCGGLCGEGWWFLLERSRDVWKVVEIEMLWIS